MPEYHVTTRGYHVIKCEVCGEEAHSAIYTEGGQFRQERDHENFRRGEGWRLFVGRTKRWYCPEDGPQPGHQMHEITS